MLQYLASMMTNTPAFRGFKAACILLQPRKDKLYSFFCIEIGWMLRWFGLVVWGFEPLVVVEGKWDAPPTHQTTNPNR